MHLAHPSLLGITASPQDRKWMNYPVRVSVSVMKRRRYAEIHISYVDTEGYGASHLLMGIPGPMLLTLPVSGFAGITCTFSGSYGLGRRRKCGDAHVSRK